MVVLTPYADASADAVAVACCSSQVENEPGVIGRADVLPKFRRFAYRGDHDVDLAVVIEIGKSCAAMDARLLEIGSHFGGNIAIEWRAGLAVARMGARRLANDHGRAVLLGVGDDDAARRRGLCFSARGVRFIDWFLVRLDVISRDPNGDDRSGSDRVRKVSRRFCHSSFTR